VRTFTLGMYQFEYFSVNISISTHGNSRIGLGYNQLNFVSTKIIITQYLL